ncbi:MAG: DUF4390 domain-containing protein [Mariprofundaceae bacterium]|nr:DUF4390 domain-containing protein [Mariprofundaceae bacterium]
MTLLDDAALVAVPSSQYGGSIPPVLDSYRFPFLLSACLLMLIVWSPSALANPKPQPPAEVRVAMDATVVYSDSYSEVPQEHIRTLLNEGAIVSTSWQLSVQRHRSYWVNERIANVEIIHQVTPDLIARRWILLDVSTGISKTTRSLQHALNFLLTMKSVPVVDRSLLQQQDELLQERGRYLLRVRLHVRDGVINPAAWRSLLRLGKTVGMKDFSLP